MEETCSTIYQLKRDCVWFGYPWRQVQQKRFGFDSFMLTSKIIYSNFKGTIIYNHDNLTFSKVYEALHTKEKMKGVVSSDGPNNL